jgi:hypothetical protein
MAVTLNANTSTGFIATSDTSGVLQLQTAGTTALTVDASQNTTLAGTLTTSSRGIAKASMPAGSVLQVVNANYSTQTSNSTSTAADTGLSATITPTSTTSKILVIVDQGGCGKQTSDTAITVNLLRGSTPLGNLGQVVAYTGTTAINAIGTTSATYLDSPATTSATTYKTQFLSWQNNASVFVQFQSSTSTITLMEIAV